MVRWEGERGRGRFGRKLAEASDQPAPAVIEPESVEGITGCLIGLRAGKKLGGGWDRVRRGIEQQKVRDRAGGSIGEGGLVTEP